MNITTAADKVRALKPGQNAAAADLYTDIDYELEYGGIDNQDDYERAEDALAFLEEHYPGVRASAQQRVVDAKHTPRLSRRAASQVWPTGDTGDAPNERRADPTPQRTSGASSRPVPAPARQRVQTRRARYQARRAPRFAAQARSVAVSVDQASGSWGADIWEWILGGMALSFLYLAVAGKGPQGVARLFAGGANVLHWVIDPTIDPHRPTAGATK